eukprot:6314606-Prorocentrum_lima.AAC.1
MALAHARGPAVGGAHLGPACSAHSGVPAASSDHHCRSAHAPQNALPRTWNGQPSVVAALGAPLIHGLQ